MKMYSFCWCLFNLTVALLFLNIKSVLLNFVCRCDSSSPYIHPIGWCQERNLPLTPPQGERPVFSQSFLHWCGTDFTASYFLMYILKRAELSLWRARLSWPGPVLLAFVPWRDWFQSSACWGLSCGENILYLQFRIWIITLLLCLSFVSGSQKPFNCIDC